MGYILPVTHYMYEQYHRRIDKRKKSPHMIDATPKVTFHTISNSYEFYAKHIRYNKKGIKEYDAVQQKDHKKKQTTFEHKGLTINETV